MSRKRIMATERNIEELRKIFQYPARVGDRWVFEPAPMRIGDEFHLYTLPDLNVTQQVR